MARLNKVIERLEQGKVVFGGGMAWTGDIENGPNLHRSIDTDKE